MNTTQQKSTILKSISIFDVLNLYTPRQLGHDGMCCCPIHKENTPSCKINKNNTFYCFSCGAHGDTIQLVQGLFNLSFPQAMDKLSMDFGLKTHLSEAEKALIAQQELDKLKKKESERQQCKTIKKYSDLLVDRLLTLRKQCTIWYKQDFLTDKEMKEYKSAKNEIRVLEKIYMGINKLIVGDDEEKRPTDIINENKNILENLQNPLTKET